MHILKSLLQALFRARPPGAVEPPTRWTMEAPWDGPDASWWNPLQCERDAPTTGFATLAEAEAFRFARPRLHNAWIVEIDVTGREPRCVEPLDKPVLYRVVFPPGYEPLTKPYTPEDFEIARRYAMREWPARVYSPYEECERP